MLPVRVVLLPALLKEEDVRDHVVVVFDVLRATTTMAAALHAGANEIRVFGSLDAAATTAAGFQGPKLLTGEQLCLKPPGFDLGNSPGDYTTERCGGRTMFMSTTNGTRGLIAARAAEQLFTGAVVNRAATAKAVLQHRLPVTLLCSGSDGQVSLEDTIGCGAVLECLAEAYTLVNDSAYMAQSLWERHRGDLVGAFSNSRGGHHIRTAELTPDIHFAAQTDALDVACRAMDDAGQLTVRPYASAVV